MISRFRNLEKIEFVVTDACSGNCRHCSEGDHKRSGISIDKTVAAEIVKAVTNDHKIKTVMAFGGEPLLCPEAVFSIMSAARDVGVGHRQVITNGYFSNADSYITEVALMLKECGVTDLRLSADAFHQEFIPLETIKRFASKLIENGVPSSVQPAWLVSKTDVNPYNLKTKAIIDELKAIGLGEASGNVVFPEGNAKKYLSEYFVGNEVKNPYVEDPLDIRCLSINYNGDVLNSNVYREDIISIIKKYDKAPL